MDCRKGWISSLGTMAWAEMKMVTFEKETPTESCWTAVLVLRPCRWEIKTMLMASSTTVWSKVAQNCPCGFPLKAIEGFAGPLVPGPQSKEWSHLTCGTQVGEAKATLQDSMNQWVKKVLRGVTAEENDLRASKLVWK